MRSRNFWILLLLLLAGIVLGGFVGEMTKGIAGLSWLNFGQSFGFDNPLVIDLGILVLTFGIKSELLWPALSELPFPCWCTVFYNDYSYIIFSAVLGESAWKGSL